MSGRPFTALIIVAGMSPFIALSFLSLAQSSIWGSWSEMVSNISGEYPLWRVDIDLLELSGSWAALAVAGGLLLWLVLISRSRLTGIVVAATLIAAQIPGIVSYTQFQWGWLFADGLPFAREPNIVIVGLALAATPAAAYGLGTASAFDRLGKTLEAANAEPEGALAVDRVNALLLLGVMAFALAVGVVTLIVLVGITAGLTAGLTAPITENPGIFTWTAVAACALIFGAVYSFLHRRWWASAGTVAQDSTSGPGSTPN